MAESVEGLEPRGAAPMRSRRVGCWGGFLLGSLSTFLFLLFLALPGLLLGGGGFRAPAEEHVALLRWEGIIGDVEVGLLGLGGSVEDFLKRLEEAQEAKGAKAIVLRLNTPGGSAAAAQEMYQGVLRARKVKPVVVSMGDVAASGGYYVASAATRIVANPATLTGSIGAIIVGYNLSELLRKLGVEPQTFKSGPHKDLLSFDRPLTEEEKRILQGTVDNVYQQFLRDVAQGRNMKVEQLQPLADGRIYTGEQALRRGLVDQLGGLRDAIDLAARLGGIVGKPKVVEYSPRSPFARWLGLRIGLGWRLWLLKPLPPLLLMP